MFQPESIQIFFIVCVVIRIQGPGLRVDLRMTPVRFLLNLGEVQEHFGQAAFALPQLGRARAVRLLERSGFRVWGV